MEKLIEKYQQIRKKIKAYQFAMTLIHWDSATEAPKGCFEERGKNIGVLSEEAYKLSTSTDYIEVVEALYANRELLNDILHHEIIEAQKALDRMRKIPQEEFVAFRVLQASSQETWVKAKHAKDFSLFAPTLEKILAYSRKYVTYVQTDTLQGYDVLLDDFEHGFTMADYDVFFDELKQEIVPLVKKISKKNKPIRDDFAKRHYPVNKQKEFVGYLMDVLCFDRNYGVTKESEHPFTTSTSSKDVRFTVHYYETDFTSAIFSAIHEIGHALYEQQSDPALDDTFSRGGASMAMHESQSRMLENMIGRSYSFWQIHYPKLQEIFLEQLKDVSLDEFYEYINRVLLSYIRVEADELTYPLHIMLRYDIEKQLFDGSLEVKDLEKAWNDLFYTYFGIKVLDASQGVLQDMHWSAGMFGYFPTYALGSSYAAQFFDTMKQEFDVENAISQPTTKIVNQWLKEKIHRYGSTKYPKEIIENANGASFDSRYYIRYLYQKYATLYEVK